MATKTKQRDEAAELRAEAARLGERIGELEPKHARAIADADEADSKIAEIARRREALVMDLYGGDEAAAAEDSELRDEAADLARRSEVAKGAAARFDEDLADLRRRLEEAEEGAERAARKAHYEELMRRRYLLEQGVQESMDAVVQGIKELRDLNYKRLDAFEQTEKPAIDYFDAETARWVVSYVGRVLDVRGTDPNPHYAIPLPELSGSSAYALGDE